LQKNHFLKIFISLLGFSFPQTLFVGTLLHHSSFIIHHSSFIIKTMIRDFLEGARSYLSAWRLMNRLGIWSSILLSGCLSLLIGGILLYGAWKTASATENYILTHYTWKWGLNILVKIAKWLSLIFNVSMAIIVYRAILTVIISPFMAPISVKVEAYLTQKSVPEPAFFSTQTIQLIVRGIQLSVRNLVRELWYTILLLILGLVPLIGWFAPMFIFMMQAFYVGFGSMDYTLERYADARGSIQFARNHRGLMIGNGSIFLLLLLIPFVGFFFAPVLSTIAATKVVLKRIHGNEKRLFSE
jgi:CysZ protein